MHSNIVCDHDLSPTTDRLQPGTPLFQRYARCPWSIASSSSKATPSPHSKSPSRGESLTFTSTVASLAAGRSSGEEGAFVNGSATGISEEEVSGRERREAKRDSSAVDGKEGRVMLLDRVGEGGLDGVIGLGTSRGLTCFH